eukprot:5233701-Pyramimonas_sp.AAC.1
MPNKRKRQMGCGERLRARRRITGRGKKWVIANRVEPNCNLRQVFGAIVDGAEHRLEQKRPVVMTVRNISYGRRVCGGQRGRSWAPTLVKAVLTGRASRNTPERNDLTFPKGDSTFPRGVSTLLRGALGVFAQDCKIIENADGRYACENRLRQRRRTVMNVLLRNKLNSKAGLVTTLQVRHRLLSERAYN